MKPNSLLTLAEKYDTPLYVYDGNKIIEKYKKFEAAFDVPQMKIHYAMKALSNISILRLLKSMGACLDCVSLEEIRLGLLAGFDPQEIMYTPNGVSINEYEKAIELGTKITVDNLSTLEKFGNDFKDTPIFIRFNPHLMAGGNSKISVGHVDSKFGISIHQMPLVLRLVENYKLNIEGIHIHTGSDIIEPEIFERVARLIFDLADHFPNISSIDFGSGFKVKYKENDIETDIEKIGEMFSKLFNEYCQKKNKDIILRFEPGKYLVSESGYFLTHVNSIKQTTACTFASVHSGFNHLIRPMFYDSYHQIQNLSNPTADKKLYSIVGYICETDTFADNRKIAEIREGDVLAFKNAGAYCFSMASNYNSRLKPAEVLMLDGKDYLIRERENFEQLTANQPDPKF